MWLDDNVPFITNTNLTDNEPVNPFYGLPFIPGQIDLSNNTLPE